MDKVGKILAQVMPNGRGPRAAVTAHVVSSNNQQTSAPARPLSGVSDKTPGREAANNAGPASEGSAARSRANESVAESRIADRSAPPRRRRMGMNTDLTRVKGILSKVLAHRGLDKKVERYEFILHWPEIVGDRLAEVTKPECIRNRALVVQVAHSVWAQELVMMKPIILQTLARYLKPGDLVQDIVCRAGDAAEIRR